MIYIINEMLDM